MPPRLIAYVLSAFALPVCFLYFVLTLPAAWSLGVGACCAVAALVLFGGEILVRRTLVPGTRAAVERPFAPRKALRRLALAGAVLFAVVSLKACWVERFRVDEAEPRTDLLLRRQYLKNRVCTPAFGPSQMPSWLGEAFQAEWAIGTLSMTTAAMVNLAYAYPETRRPSLALIRGMVRKMLSREMRRYELLYWNEDALDSLEGDNGHIGYLGHLAFMLGGYRLLGGAGEFDALHSAVTDALARRLDASPSHVLETFPGQVFLPDNMVVLASIALHDRIHGPSHQAVLDSWLRYARRRLLDPRTGLIARTVDPSGRPVGGSRGSYAAWNGFYLPFVDAAFARQQFSRLKRHHGAALPFGAAAMREYPHGQRGSGDIDSGPVVFGLSTSGTGFAIAGAHRAADLETLNGLLLTAEVVGSSWDTSQGRRYLAAPLIGDAILLAMRTACDWDERYLSPPRAGVGHTE